MFPVTLAGGQAMAPADVCKTPMPPAPPTPIPYPNIAMPPMGMQPSQKVLIAGAPALTKASKIPITNGNQAGAVGGVVSGVIMGETEFILGSMKVKIEGNPAVRLSDPTKHNKGNTVGNVIAPSQTKVMVMS